MTTLDLLTPIPVQGLPPAGSEALGVGLEMLAAAVVLAALFVVFGLQTRRDSGGCGSCGGDACGTDSCPSTHADPFREEIS